jgi:DNA-binding NarL/FixJ family response regulator
MDYGTRIRKVIHATPRFCTARACAHCWELESPDALALPQNDTAVASLPSPHSNPNVEPTLVAAVGCNSSILRILTRIFGDVSEFASAGFFRLGAPALSALSAAEVHLVLTDFALPDCCGLKFVHELRRQKPHIQAIIVTHWRDPLLVGRAAACGVSQLLICPLHIGQCLASLRFASHRLLPRSCVRGPASSGATPSGSGSGLRKSLNAREESFLASLADGLLYKEIETRLRLSHSLLRKLQTATYRKLGTHTRMEAVKLWQSAPPQERPSQARQL